MATLQGEKSTATFQKWFKLEILKLMKIVFGLFCIFAHDKIAKTAKPYCPFKNVLIFKHQLQHQMQASRCQIGEMSFLEAIDLS